ncbi:MAG: hypothetical protein H6713_31185 [Myxococcales bacterium]|nr:hypothetical protein [Myxococcales bacterium]
MDLKRIGRVTLTTFEWIGVVVCVLLLIVVVAIGGMLGWVGSDPAPMGDAGQAVADEPADAVAAAPAPAPTPAEASSLFAPVHRVLVSPRCMNCHPEGDRPLADRGGAHAMNISRASADSGLACSTCHAEHNSVVPGGPPGAPHWQLPPAETPMVFQGRSVTALCLQLRDRAHNGERTLEQLLEHVSKDPLVLWGWSPGGDRVAPPLSHADFVAGFSAWVAAGGICPGETEPPALEPEADAESGAEGEPA